MKFSAILLLGATAFYAALAEEEHKFTYKSDVDEAFSPSEWAEGFATCGGSRQSPIDITESTLCSVYVPPPESFAGSCPNYKITEDEESYKAAVDGGNCTVSAKGETFNFAQFHVHTPSEHTIDGKVFDGEIHFVHKSADGKAALVIGLFLEKTEDEDTDPAVDLIVDAMSEVTLNTTIPVTMGSYAELIETYVAKGHVFNYPGSLTTPPCTEFVDWWVVRAPVPISSEQLERIEANLAELAITDNGKNARPVQPLNGRTVMTKFAALVELFALYVSGLVADFAAAIINNEQDFGGSVLNLVGQMKMHSSASSSSHHHVGQILQSLKNPQLVRSKCFVDGEWVEGRGGEYFAVVDPATNEVLADVPCMGKEETHEAIAAAFVAQRRWKKITPPARSTIMKKWHAAIVENAEDLAIIASCESAKPLEEARSEVEFTAGIVDYYAHEIVRSSGYLVTPSDPDKKVLVMKEPVGVCAIMSPWNFPYATVARNLAPCVASGCAAVVKPSGKTPLSMLALAKLAEDAGVPAGVINVVTAPRGSHSGIGKELTTNPDVRLVAFTGSTPAGKKLMEQASSTVKHVVLELGGNAPFIVFDDADIENALDGLIVAKFRNSGQTCVTSNRIFVHSSIYDSFTSKLVERVEELKIGLPMEHGAKLGPLIGPEAVEKVVALVDDAVTHGAKVLTGGKTSDIGKNFYEATVLTNVNDKMRIWSEEIFGPVVPVFSFSSEEVVVRKANDTDVGLAGYFYTEDLSRIFRVASELEVGMVAVNAGVVSIVQAPFGGVKESGVGREGSPEGLEEYLESKMVCIGGLN